MYHNPVKVVETNNWRKAAINYQKYHGIKNPVIITSSGNLKRQKLSTVFKSDSILSIVKPNPTFESFKMAINFGHKSKFDGVIAIGGGSVLDTAKVVMASIGTGINDVFGLLNVNNPYENKIASIFIPTTHGSGSEVTMWGTIWEMKEQKKYSISHPDLYPDIAILDGSLTLSLPPDISITTVLDALSHSFEAIWNKNANSLSTNYAIEAICLILKNVEKLKIKCRDIKLRKICLQAANKAGLAIAGIKTAAAHSISYPLTIRYGIPHGVACSLPILPLLKINKASIEKELNIIMEKLKLVSLSEMEECINRIPRNILRYTLRDWGVSKSDLNTLVELSFTNGRMDNNIVDLTVNHVLQILIDIY